MPSLAAHVRYRNQIMAWQHEHEPSAPRVGDVAPDFDLSSSRGDRRTRLSAFRGKRPVALVFGSYT